MNLSQSLQARVAKLVGRAFWSRWAKRSGSGEQSLCTLTKKSSTGGCGSQQGRR